MINKEESFKVYEKMQEKRGECYELYKWMRQVMKDAGRDACDCTIELSIDKKMEYEEPYTDYAGVDWTPIKPVGFCNDLVIYDNDSGGIIAGKIYGDKKSLKGCKLNEKIVKEYFSNCGGVPQYKQHLKITANGHWREIHYFGYEDGGSITDGEDRPCFVYKGYTYYIDEFIRLKNNPWMSEPDEDLRGWDAILYTSAFSGLLIKLSDCGDAVKVGRY